MPNSLAAFLRFPLCFINAFFIISSSISCKDKFSSVSTSSAELSFFTLERKPVFINRVEVIPETKIQCIVKKNNSENYWIGSEEDGLFLLSPSSNKKNKFNASSIGKKSSIPLTKIEDIYEDKLSNLWVATFGNGVIKLVLSPSSLQYEEFFQFSEENIGLK